MRYLPMNYLMVGGAGYIGSHVARELVRAGQDATILDDLSKGHREAVRGLDLVIGDLGDVDLVSRVLEEKEIGCVMHFAAFSLVGESVEHPLPYYDNNVGKTTRLLTAMKEKGVPKFVLSSTAAVYGEPSKVPIEETDALIPTNPYGRTKLMIEQILEDADQAYGMKYASLRYFNAAGADEKGDIGEDHDPETHLIPLVLQVALGQRKSISVFGTDWDTPDGTCIRDYVHVSDLAQAHILAAERLAEGRDSMIYNLGCQAGYSVLEIIEIARRVTGHKIPAVEADRRPGDPERLVASSARIRSELGWNPVYEDPERMIRTAWNWHRTHPHGFKAEK
jgi:UDP-glucose 4-epimerase